MEIGLRVVMGALAEMAQARIFQQIGVAVVREVLVVVGPPVEAVGYTSSVRILL
jgi:hypothetical protein